MRIISQKTILDLVILNLIQAILTVVIIVLLSSCAPGPRAPLWLRATETLPQVEGFSRAGLFTINGKIYVQFCDPNGNQKWLRYNEGKHTWRESRYNSQGCSDSDNASGPEM
jgi:hypothetical protein